MSKEMDLISKLMKTMGMNHPGTYLPIANQENLELLRRLEQKGVDVLKLHEELEDHETHCETLRVTRTSVLSRNDVCQKAIQAKASVLLSESSMLKLTENGSRYYNRECSRLTTQLREQRKANKITTGKLKQREATVQEISKKIQLEVDVIEKFKKTMNETDGELEIMRKFMKLDHVIVEDCEMKEKHLVRMLEASKRQFDATLAETRLCERELSRVTADFRRIHKERNDSVNRWKETLNYIKNKDMGIDAIAEEYRLHHHMSRTLDSFLEKKQAMLDECALNLRAVEYKLKEADVNIAELQVALNAKKKYASDISVQTADARCTISRVDEAIRELEKQKKRIDKIREKTETKKKELETEVEILRIRHAETLEGKLSAEEGLEAVYKMVETEQEKVNEAKNRLEVFRNFYMTKLQDRNDLKRDNTVMEHRLAEGRNWIKNTVRQIKELAYQLERKKQLLFKLQLDKFKYLNRVADLTNSASVISKEDDLKMSIYNKKYLDTCRTERTHLYNLKIMLSTQVGSLDVTIVKAIRSISAQEANRASLKAQLKLYCGDNKRIAYQGAQLIVQHQNLFMDEQMIKITLSRLKKQLKQRNHHNLNLASKRALMQAVAKERRSEVKLHLKLLQERKRDLGAYASKLILQKREVLKDTEVKKKGYDITTSSLITREDREAGIGSEASIILKHAQDREMMNREMECWRNRIASAEAETVGLRNNLDIMTALNATLKQSVSIVEVNEKDESRLKELKRIGLSTTTRKRRAIKESANLERKLEEIGFKISQLEIIGFSTANSLENKNRELYLIEIELANQKAKIQRAKKVFEIGSKSLRKLSTSERRLIETDLRVRCVWEKFKFSLQHLDRAIGVHPKLKDQVQAKLNQSPALPIIANNLQMFGRCARPASLVRCRRKTGVFAKHDKRRDGGSGGASVQSLTPPLSASSLGSTSTRSYSHSGKVTAVGSHGSHLVKPDESHPGKPTTVDKLLHAMHSAQSVVASQVKKEEYEKLKESYQQHKEIMENEAAVEHAFEVGMGFF